MRCPSLQTSSGFSLLETLIATSILVTVLAGVAQLLVFSVRFAHESGRRLAALVAAEDKLESLQSLAWAYGPSGEPVTDPAIDPSPPGTLTADVPGYVEWLDEGGRVVAGGPQPGAGVLSTRRWAITSLDGRAPEAIAIEVCVFRDTAQSVSPDAADACVATIRSRQP